MLQVSGAVVEFDGEAAVADVDLTLPAGEVLAVLGPSGCGKSTLLRAIAGVQPLTRGRIAFDGVDLARVPTHRRGFALMFQDGQLFDHLDVAGNVGYALRRRDGVTRERRRERVAELLELTGLAGYAARMPRTLSGGERQRVALARSLAAEPRLLLLDEPLSALDAGLRTRLAADLRAILTASGATALMVTHDHDEAFAVADRLAVMRAGRLVQSGVTREVWATPVDEDTARFLGYTRVLDGEAARRLAGTSAARETCRVAVRASAVVLETGGPWRGVVRSTLATPDGTRLVAEVDGLGELDAVAAAGALLSPGDRVAFRIDQAGLAVLPPRVAGPEPEVNAC